MNRKLEVFPAIGEAFVIGTKNAVPLVLTVLLYVLTIWIPYLNVGTTIAMNTIPRKLASGEILNPLFIFESIYRRKMGSYFLLKGFMSMMLLPALLLMVIPAIVLNLMYSLALYIMLDDDLTPTEALERSNRATYGYKWEIFSIKFLMSIAICVMTVIIAWVGVLVLESIEMAGIELLILIALPCVVIIAITCVFAIDAVIYRNLYLRPNANMQEQNETFVE